MNGTAWQTTHARMQPTPTTYARKGAMPMPPEIKMIGVLVAGRWNVDGRTVIGTKSPGCSWVIHVEHTPLRESRSGVVDCQATIAWP